MILDSLVSFMKNFFLAIWIISWPLNAISGLEIDQELSFGEIVILDNSAPHTIEVTTQGNTSQSNQIISITPAQNGRFLLTDLPINSQIDIQIDSLPSFSTFNSGAHPAVFTIEILLSNSTYTSNELGEVLLTVGGRLTTSANGSRYIDGSYHQTYQMTIDY